MRSMIGDYLKKKIKCDPGATVYAGLNSVTADAACRKREKFLDVMQVQCSRYSRDKLGVLLDEAIEDESRLRGAGDVVHRIATAIGIKEKRDCRCGKRRRQLNHLIPFRSTK